MDFEWVRSLAEYKHGSTWVNVNSIGCESRLTSAQRFLLLKLERSDTTFKKSHNTYYTKLEKNV